MSYFLSRIRRVNIRDILQVWKLFVCFLPAKVLKAVCPDIWIVSEAPGEARDNGFWFFRYVCQNHPEHKCYYAIKKDSPDYDKVASVGSTVEHGSLKHWVLYLAANKIVSSQKAMGPNAAIFSFLEVYGLLKNDRSFLQHGVIKDDLKWLYYDITKFNIFICGAFPEYNYVSDTFGYPKGIVQYTGLCRFDGLHDGKPADRLILIMPTWREWIAYGGARLVEIEGTDEVQNTEYFKTWTSFIQDNRIRDYCKKYHVKFIFFPHRDMQKYLEFLPKSNIFITVAGAGDYDVQELLKRASLMITDYSSVFFDMLYMKKPVIFYQFDYDRFRSGQYGEGYFDYRNNPFGNSFENADSVFEEVELYLKNNFKVDDDYLKAHNYYFKLYDTNNCERVYKVITGED